MVVLLVILPIALMGFILVHFLQRSKKKASDKKLSQMIDSQSSGSWSQVIELGRAWLCENISIRKLQQRDVALTPEVLDRYLAQQTEAAKIIRQAYEKSGTEQPKELITRIEAALMKQKEIIHDQGLFPSFLSLSGGSPKREMVELFSIAQNEKEECARRLPNISS